MIPRGGRVRNNAMRIVPSFAYDGTTMRIGVTSKARRREALRNYAGGLRVSV